MARFEDAIEIILRHEGGYVCDPDDPGGETNYGISKRRYPGVDIKALARARAIEMYRRDYWRYDAVHSQPVANKLFDMAVNMGPGKAHLLVQHAVNRMGASVATDGKFGLRTLVAVNAAEQAALLTNLRALCVEFYRDLAETNSALRKFLPGWIKRAVS